MSTSLEQPTRLHPLTLVYRLLVSLPGFVLILYFNQSQTATWANATFLVLYGLVAIPWAVLYYVRFQYAISPTQVTIQQGVLTRQDRSIPMERIQNVEIRQSFLQRLLQIARVRIETPGSGLADGVLEFVGLDSARAIRTRIQNFKREGAGSGAAEDENGDEDTTGDPPTPEITQGQADDTRSRKLYNLSRRRLVLRGIFTFSLVYIAVIFSAMEYLNIRPEEWILQDQYEPYWTTVSAFPLLAGFILVIAACILGWATGIALSINSYYGFSLNLSQNKLHKSHGLFTHQEGTVPLEKIQAYMLRSNLLMRWFGWYGLEVQAMGLQTGLQGRQIAAPLVTLDEAEELISQIQPVTFPSDFASVSRKTIRRSIFRYVATLLVTVGTGVWFWSSQMWYALAAVPVLVFVAFKQYQHHGFAYDDEHDIFVVRRGFFRHRIWFVPAENVQVLYSTANPFQRRLNLTSVHIDTAGGASSRYPQVVDLPTAGGQTVMKRLYERFLACTNSLA